MARVTQEIAVERIRAAIGDTYDFSKSVYVNHSTKMTVICPRHGEFSRLPPVFWKGAGCHACSFRNRIDMSEVLERFRKAHGDRYDYSEVTYTHSEKPVIIGCRKHGQFLQRPTAHWKGSGCSTCLKGAARPHRLKNSRVLERFAEIHGNKYDYRRTKYEKITVPVEITCRQHGVFSQTPMVHLNGSGCPRCSNSVSKPETRWADALESFAGWKVHRQQAIKGVLGRVDMVVEHSHLGKIVVEYDGCYWHSREGSLERDERKTRLLADAGYKVVRLREEGNCQLRPVPYAFLNFPASDSPSESDVRRLAEQMEASSSVLLKA